MFYKRFQLQRCKLFSFRAALFLLGVSIGIIKRVF